MILIESAIIVRKFKMGLVPN